MRTQWGTVATCADIKRSFQKIKTATEISVAGEGFKADGIQLTGSMCSERCGWLNEKPRTWERPWQKALLKTKDWLNCYAETRPWNSLRARTDAIFNIKRVSFLFDLWSNGFELRVQFISEGNHCQGVDWLKSRIWYFFGIKPSWQFFLLWGKFVKYYYLIERNKEEKCCLYFM